MMLEETGANRQISAPESLDAFARRCHSAGCPHLCGCCCCCHLGVACEETDGSIIPFASGDCITASTKADGQADFPNMIGFGTAYKPTQIPFGPTLDLTTAQRDLAFSVPRDGVIKAIDAHFTVYTPLSCSHANITLHAQLYQADRLSDVFTAIPGAQVNLSPGFAGNAPQGAVSEGFLTNLSIPVTARNRLLLVFYATACGACPAQSVIGFADAGVWIG